MESIGKPAAPHDQEPSSRQAPLVDGPSSAQLQVYTQRDPNRRTSPITEWRYGLAPSWLFKSIDLVRRREAGEVLTDQLVEAECEHEGIDPVPVMLLVQSKKPRPWGAYLIDPNGTTKIVGKRLIGHWYDFCDRPFTIIDTPGGKSALKVFLEITGLPAPRQSVHPPFPLAIHEHEIPRDGPFEFAKQPKAKTRKKVASRRGRGTE